MQIVPFSQILYTYSKAAMPMIWYALCIIGRLVVYHNSSLHYKKAHDVKMQMFLEYMCQLMFLTLPLWVAVPNFW